MLLLWLVVMVNAAYGHSTCSAVAMNQNSFGSVTTVSVTCDFGKNISLMNFNAFFYYGPGCDEFEKALVCNRREDRSLLCMKGKGVVFDEKQMVVDQLEFTISSSCMTSGTQFVCQTVREQGAESCNVTYDDGGIAATSTIAARGAHPASGSSLHMSWEEHSPLKIAIIVILVFLLAAFIMAIVAGYCYRERIRRWCLGPLGERWPGVVKDPENPPKAEDPTENSSPSTPMLAGEASVPEGLPLFFYNMGKKDAEKRVNDKERAVANGTH